VKEAFYGRPDSRASGSRISAAPLQGVDKADLDAVRAFVPGKLLGRTAALLSLTVLTLAQMGALDVALRKVFDVDLTSFHPLWRFGLIGALPVLVIGVQLFVEWRAQAQARRIRDRTVAVATAKDHHFKVGPYEAGDQGVFDRADKVHETVLRWILATSQDTTPLYLTGDSGTGKSSLLTAYVIPNLRKAKWGIVQARAYGDPEVQLRKVLIPHLPPPVRLSITHISGERR
jgi:hypothetical protein